ncbi:methyltransferase/methylase [Mycobacterium tuberculosis]|nr:methyltransferase/methylase [Mycobacterium tuberculosis]
MREAAQALGFEVLDQRDLVRNLRTHYSRVFEELEARRLELEGKSSQEYLDKMRRRQYCPRRTGRQVP